MATCRVIADELQAIRHSLDTLREGERVVIFTNATRKFFDLFELRGAKAVPFLPRGEGTSGWEGFRSLLRSAGEITGEVTLVEGGRCPVLVARDLLL